MFKKLALAFICIPIIEIFLLVALSKAIGWGALVLVLVTGIIGALLVKSQSLRTMLAFRAGRSSMANAAADGIMILVAGICLLTPGILTDIAGFSLLTPGIRDRLRATAIAAAKSRTSGQFGFPGSPQPSDERASERAPKEKKSRPTVIDV